MAFRDEDRAQSVQIGAVLLFGILIIALSIHQAYVVPGQNREVEFTHFAESQDDMVHLRNAVIEAGEQGETVPAGVSLGTTYPARVFVAQPPTSSGTLRTDTIGGASNELRLKHTDADMGDICGLGTLTMRTATYRPDYNYLDSVGAVTYENTLTYTDGAREGRAIQTDQQLVDGTTIQVFPLLGDYNRGGSGVATMTLRGGTTGENASVPGGFSLILPTQLSASEWSDVLSGQSQVSSVQSVTGQEAVNITFASGTDYDIRCSPAGAGTAPNNSPSVGGGNENAINPNFGSDVILVEAIESEDAGSGLATNQVSIELRNTNEYEYQNITMLRYPFFSARPGDVDDVTLPDSFEYDGTVIERTGTYAGVGPVTFAPDETKSLTLAFYTGATGSSSSSYNLASGDSFVVTAFFDDGTERTYFVALNNSCAGEDRCDPDPGGGGPGGP